MEAGDDDDADEEAEDTSDAETEASEKYEHLGVIGAIAVEGDATTPAEYFIRYPKQITEDWSSIHDECMLLPHEDFKYNLVDVPAVDRGSLGWDEQANGKDVLFLYGKRGMQYWYHAALSNFDASTLDHTVTPFNGDRALVVNLF